MSKLCLVVYSEFWAQEDVFIHVFILFSMQEDCWHEMCQVKIP